ncbi:MAG: flagellar biosynthetic protein FliO [Melioribacteraceae bacterium]|nr:flagellar biosynthetic protein FliO [Melioribacteraceae bacterium]
MSSLEILQSFVPLILVLLLLYAVLYFVKRKGFRLNPIGSKVKGIEILATQTIMPKKFLTLIRVKDKVLLVGIAENTMSVLKEIDYDGTDLKENTDPVNESFGDILKKNLGLK